MGKGIAFNAELKKVSTTLDGGWTITFSAGQNEVSNILELSKYRDMLLSIAIVPINNDKQQEGQQHERFDSSSES